MHFRTQPYGHQEKALSLGYDRAEFAYLMDMGTGKTKVLIDDACNHFLAGDITGLLVMAPKGVYRNWIGELQVHSSVSCYVATWKDYETVGGTRELERACTPEPGKMSVLLINIEAMQKGKRGRAAKAVERFMLAHNRRVLFAIDESTKIKSSSAERTKEVIRLSGLANFRRILTGSPITNSPLDLYSQASFLHKRLLGEPSIFTFRKRYCIMVEQELAARNPDGTHKTYPMIIGYRRLEELNEKLKAFSYRVTKDECLDLPPKVYVKRDVALTQQQLQLYTDMKRRCVAEVQGQLVTAPIALTKILRLHQIVCGVLKDDDGTLHDLENNRLDELMGVLEESTSKAIIWASFTRNIEQIQERITQEHGPQAVVTYYGATSPDDRQLAIERFQNDPDCRYFVANQDTGGYGITLTAAGLVVYYSNTYSLEKRQQSEDRAHRIGQTKSVTYVDLRTPGTVDDNVVKALLEKWDVASKITGDVLKAWLTI